MSYCEGFWLILPSWNSEHWPLGGESLGLVSRFFPFLSSLPSADPGHTTRRLKYSHKFHNSQTLNSFQIEMHEAASWVGCLMPGRGWHLQPGSRGTRYYDEEIQSDKARGVSLTTDINTWQHCVARSKCVIPTKATQSHNATWFPN